MTAAQRDLFDNHVSPASPEKTGRKSSELPVSASIFCDGASSGNPGHAGIGVVIKRQKPDIRTQTAKDGSKTDDPESIIRISEYIGIATNNTAEYMALIRGLKEALSLQLDKLNIFLDSELLVNQINGTYRVKSTVLKPLFHEAIRLLAMFKGYSVFHIGRERNKEADKLAKKGLKKRNS